MKPPCTDIFSLFINNSGNGSYLVNGIVRKFQINTFSSKEGSVLFYYCIVGLGKNPDKLILPQGVQFNPYGEPPLEFRYKI